MPDGGIKVNYATIYQASDDCNKTGGELDSLFQELVSDLRPLTDSWTGDAQAAWGEKQRLWNEELDKLKSLLARIATALPQVADGYQETDKSVQNLF